MSDDTDRDKLIEAIDHARSSGDYTLAGTTAIADAILAEFLPEHDKQVKADAWDEGFTACDNWDAASMSTIPKNPYRERDGNQQQRGVCVFWPRRSTTAAASGQAFSASFPGIAGNE